MFLEYLIAFLIILLIVDLWKPKRLAKLHRQLGNDWPYVPIIGNGFSFLGNDEDRMKKFIQLATLAYERQHTAISFWLGRHLHIAISDGDQACAVLKSALDKKYMYRFTKPVIGNGSIFAPVDIWHRRRKILTPTFAPRFVNQFVKVFEVQSKVLVEVLECRVGKGNFSCFESISNYAMDSVCETLFDVNLKVQQQSSHPIINIFTEIMKIVAARLVKPWLHIDAIYHLLPVYARQTRLVKLTNEFLDDLIRKKESEIYENNGKEKEIAEDKLKLNFKSILDLMVTMSNDPEQGCTHEEIREEMSVLRVAGTDTSSVVTCFTILMLAQYPDIQEKVYKEIQEHYGNNDKTIQAGDLIKLKYLRAVIKETLRLYPPVPVTSRYCEKDVELPSGLVLPAGCNVIINIWGIHHNAQHWGEDVNEFNPDRFLSGHIPPNAFQPFSFGSRNCIGQQYAMLLMSTTLVTLLRRFRFKPATNFKYDKNNPLRLTFDIIMKHVENFPVQIEHRDEYKAIYGE